MRKYSVAIPNSHPVQYAAPLYRRLAEEPDLDVTVYFYSRQGLEEFVDPGFGQRIKWDTPLLEGYRYHFLPNLRRRDRVGGFVSLINPTIITELCRNRHDALLMIGYAYASDWLAFLAARLLDIPVLFLSESSLVYDLNVQRPWHVRFFKPRLLRRLFRRLDAFLAIGTLNAEFYRHYGVKPERIFPFPHTVDNAFFKDRSAAYRARRDALREGMGIGPEDVVFLFAAKMTAVKSPLELLEAYRRMAQGAAHRTALLMVGDGDLRPEAEAFVKKHGLSKVVFTGFVNQSELPQYYAVSDVFIRPDGLSRGDWGLTVNEAMACGLAVISSDKIGATRDLVRHGENGCVVRFGEVDALADAMGQLAGDPGKTRAMGERSREIIQTWSFEENVSGLRQALHWLDQGRR